MTLKLIVFSANHSQAFNAREQTILEAKPSKLNSLNFSGRARADDGFNRHKNDLLSHTDEFEDLATLILWRDLFKMNLLLINFAMDESHGALAYQIDVARELAAKVDFLTVITEQIGEISDLPDNVSVLTPPIRPLHIPQRVGGRWAFNWHVFQICRKRQIDAVFVHMAHEWSVILSPAFKILRIPIVTWYEHKSTPAMMRCSSILSDRLISATKQGFRLKTQRHKAIGHAIVTDRFREEPIKESEHILYVGRISPRKRLGLIVDVAKHIETREELKNVQLSIVGPTLTDEDRVYDQRIRNTIWQNNLVSRVNMYGFVPARFIPHFYKNTFLHLNFSHTGSMDKTVLEALASGCPVLTSNEAFFDLLTEFPEFLVKDESHQAIADQIEYIYRSRGKYDPKHLRSLVERNHAMSTFADRVLNEIPLKARSRF